MAKDHWQHSVIEQDNGYALTKWGCQHSTCTEHAVHSWRRKATDAEVEAEAALEGLYGRVIRSSRGPHHVAVFACAEHALPAEGMADTHGATCPAPDPGCDCNDEPGPDPAPRG